MNSSRYDRLAGRLGRSIKPPPRRGSTPKSDRGARAPRRSLAWWSASASALGLGLGLVIAFAGVGCQSAQWAGSVEGRGEGEGASNTSAVLVPRDFVAKSRDESDASPNTTPTEEDDSVRPASADVQESVPSPTERAREQAAEASDRAARDGLFDRAAPGDPGPPEVGATATATARPAYLAASRPGVPVTVSGVVGQVNGRPIFVEEVLAPINDQLAVWGREMSYREFIEAARSLIRERLMRVVEHELLLAEAESSLSSEQRVGLRFFLEDLRLNRVLEGGGSLRQAERRMREESGLTLDEHLDQQRRELLIQEHLRNTIGDRIIVSWRDIEQYYRENQEEFNPPASMRIRLIGIRGPDEDKARRVNEALRQGQPFEYVAAEYTDVLQSSDGLMSPVELQGDQEIPQVTAWPEVNQALAGLERGEYAGPIDVGPLTLWAYVEEYSDGEPISLYEAQKEIESKLRAQMMQQELREYSTKLRERGNYDDIGIMADSLLAVALDRWAPEQ